MSSAFPSEHWLDRVAKRYTRRQALRSTSAAAAAALTFPLLKSTPARATTGPTACQKGCYWTTHQLYDQEGGRCLVRANGKFDAALLLFPFTFGATFTSIGTQPVGYFMRCIDNAALTMKWQQAQCREPGCGTFNPKGKGGPCDGVQSNCCPCDSIDSGYIPCIYDCNDPDHNCCPSG